MGQESNLAVACIDIGLFPLKMEASVKQMQESITFFLASLLFNFLCYLRSQVQHNAKSANARKKWAAGNWWLWPWWARYPLGVSFAWISTFRWYTNTRGWGWIKPRLNGSIGLSDWFTTPLFPIDTRFELWGAQVWVAVVDDICHTLTHVTGSRATQAKQTHTAYRAELLKHWPLFSKGHTAKPQLRSPDRFILFYFLYQTISCQTKVGNRGNQTG